MFFLRLFRTSKKVYIWRVSVSNIIAYRKCKATQRALADVTANAIRHRRSAVSKTGWQGTYESLVDLSKPEIFETVGISSIRQDPQATKIAGKCKQALAIAWAAYCRVSINEFRLAWVTQRRTFDICWTVSDRYSGTVRCKSSTHRQFAMCDSLCESISHSRVSMHSTVMYSALLRLKQYRTSIRAV
jgi:hypothetical protein